MFYNTYRTTKSSNQQRMNTNLSKNGAAIINPKERLVNLQKREKLKGLLITKFMKKYGIKNPEKILEDEISKFLQGEKLNDADLQRLDAKIHRMLMDKKSREGLKNSLTQTLQQYTIKTTGQNIAQEENIYPAQCQPSQEQAKLPTPKQTPKPCTASCVTRGGNKVYKSPEEELAELER